MKKIYLIATILFSISSFAQEIIATSGNHYNNGTYSMSFTIGEPIIATYSNGTNILTQGFHQTKLTDVSTFIKNYYNNTTISVFPNPAINSVQIAVNSQEQIQYTTKIYDISGKTILELNNSNNQTQSIAVSNWSVGTYIVQVLDHKNQLLATAKIVKQ